jgi:hypothetical protein
VEIMAEPDSVEFRIGRVIGHSFGVFRRNFVGFSILALLINLLWWLYLFYLSPAALKALGAVGAYLLWWLIWMLTESLTQAAVVFETFHDLHGSKASIVKCITHGLTTMLPHIAGTVLFNIVRLIVVALPVLAVIFFAGWLDTTLPHFKGTLLYTIVLFIGFRPVQVGESSLQQDVLVRRAGDVTGSAGTGAAVPDCLQHRCQHSWMLPHAEIVVGTPDRHVGTETMFQCARELADAPLQFSEHPVPPFRLQCVEACRKELLAPFRSVEDRRGRPLIVCVKLRHGILAIDSICAARPQW